MLDPGYLIDLGTLQKRFKLSSFTVTNMAGKSHLQRTDNVHFHNSAVRYVIEIYILIGYVIYPKRSSNWTNLKMPISPFVRKENIL